MVPPRWILIEWSRPVSYYVWVIAEKRSMWPKDFRSYVFYRRPVCQFCDYPLIVRRLSKNQNEWSRPVEFWLSDPAPWNSDWVVLPCCIQIELLGKVSKKNPVIFREAIVGPPCEFRQSDPAIWIFWKCGPARHKMTLYLKPKEIMDPQKWKHFPGKW